MAGRPGSLRLWSWEDQPTATTRKQTRQTATLESGFGRTKSKKIVNAHYRLLPPVLGGEWEGKWTHNVNWLVINIRHRYFILFFMYKVYRASLYTHTHAETLDAARCAGGGISTRSTNCSLTLLLLISKHKQLTKWKEWKERKGGINDLMSSGWWWRRQKRVDDDVYVQWWVTIRLASQIINIYRKNEYNEEGTQKWICTGADRRGRGVHSERVEEQGPRAT